MRRERARVALTSVVGAALAVCLSTRSSAQDAEPSPTPPAPEALASEPAQPARCGSTTRSR